MVTLYPSLVQKIKERNNHPPKSLLADHKRGQKFRNSWRETEGGETNRDAKKPWHEVYASKGGAGGNVTVPDHKQRQLGREKRRVAEYSLVTP